MPTADSQGARIHYEVSGSGEPLLLVMGYGLSGDAWAPMLPLLQGYRTIVLDNRGTGGSDPAGEGFSMSTMAADAAAVLRDAGVARAHVHGVSMGGMIAQTLALEHPDVVHTLALGCTTPSAVRFMPDDQNAVLDLFRGSMLMATDPDAGLDVLLPILFSAEFLRDNPTVRDLARQLVAGSAPVGPEALHAMTSAMADMSTGRIYDVVDRLDELHLPVLVQHGSADRIIPVAAGRFLAENIAGAEYQELEGAGHAYGMERPLEAFPRLLTFLRAHPLAA